jgi:hypothetical protein
MAKMASAYAGVGAWQKYHSAGGQRQLIHSALWRRLSQRQRRVAGMRALAAIIVASAAAESRIQAAKNVVMAAGWRQHPWPGGSAIESESESRGWLIGSSLQRRPSMLAAIISAAKADGKPLAA